MRYKRSNKRKIMWKQHLLRRYHTALAFWHGTCLLLKWDRCSSQTSIWPQKEVLQIRLGKNKQWERSRNGSRQSNLNAEPFSPRGKMLSTPPHPTTHINTHTKPCTHCKYFPTYHFHFLKNNRFHFFLRCWFTPSFPLVIFFFL